MMLSFCKAIDDEQKELKRHAFLRGPQLCALICHVAPTTYDDER